MRKKLRILGAVFGLIGLGFVITGIVAYTRVQDGYDSLQAFSEAQNVTLSYNEDGQLIDRGTTEGADAILTLLEDEWNYPVNGSDLNPNDPLVNTGTEYMYQMATIVYHVLHGDQTIVLEEGVTYDGEYYAAGEYTFPVEGRYWTEFDRMHPIEGPARAAAWSGTVHGLVGELGVGTVTHSTLQMGLAMAAFFGAVGLSFWVAAAGMFWLAGRRPDKVEEIVEEEIEAKIPDTVPKEFVEKEELITG